MIDYYPFHELLPVPNYLELLRARFQECSVADENFWYVAQGWSEKAGCDPPGDFCRWRRPTPEALNASVTLALAQGSKEITFLNYK